MVQRRLKKLLTPFLCLLAANTGALAQSDFEGFTLPFNTRGKMAWNEFKERFVAPDGRVIDDANGGISHSEGQGYGMLIAAEHRDLSTFSVIWNWTRKNLQTRKDGLFAWKWDPSIPEDPVIDQNNATDGDILIAWALLRGGELWKNDRHIEEAKAIARKVRTTMIADSPYGPLLLPGGTGFQQPEGTIINLSYWVFPAFLDIRRIDPSHLWDDLYLSGLRLLKEARFGDWDLPPDWLLVSSAGTLILPKQFDPVFGYNAVRIPLYMEWAGIGDEFLYRPFVGWATSKESIFELPDTVNLVTNEPGEFTVIPGMIAIYHLIAPREIPEAPRVDGDYTSYYSASLRFLSHLAEKEGQKYSLLPHP
ncbi:MAG: glycosyl hydrolase family 8 [Verrucomicrobiota bacterium]